MDIALVIVIVFAALMFWASTGKKNGKLNNVMAGQRLAAGDVITWKGKVLEILDYLGGDGYRVAYSHHPPGVVFKRTIHPGTYV